jgi:hypothetical protein
MASGKIMVDDLRRHSLSRKHAAGSCLLRSPLTPENTICYCLSPT